MSLIKTFNIPYSAFNPFLRIGRTPHNMCALRAVATRNALKTKHKEKGKAKILVRFFDEHNKGLKIWCDFLRGNTGLLVAIADPPLPPIKSKHHKSHFFEF